MPDSEKVLLRVRDWTSIYENARSKQIEKLSWVMVPNGHDGTGYRMIISRSDGLEILGAWLIILQVASRCTPRGTLVRDNGNPHTAVSIAAKTGARAEVLAHAIQVLLDVEIAWLEGIPCTSMYMDVHKSTLYRTEGIEGTVGNRTERTAYIAKSNGHAKSVDHSQAFDVWVDRQYSRHPKKKNKPLAEQILADRFHDASQASLDAFETNHKAWCESEDWTKQGGRFAPQLAEWIADDGHLSMPHDVELPGHMNPGLRENTHGPIPAIPSPKKVR